jgi:hypothetical protein
MEKPVLDPSFEKSQRISLWVCNVLIILMMTCLGFSTVQMGLRFNPTWQGGYLPWLCCIIAIEAIYSYNHIPDLEFRDRTIFRVAELLTIALLYRFFLIAKDNPLTNIIAEISSWQSDFLAKFFSMEYLFGIAILGLVWSVTTQITTELIQLHDREKDAVWDELGKLQNALHIIRKKIVDRAVIIGGIVVVTTIVARMNLRDFIQIGDFHFDQGMSTLIVLVYAVLALALLSQTQLAFLRTRWIWAKSPVSSKLSRNWLTYSLIFLGVLGLFAFLMPTDYSMGFFQTIGYLIGLIFELGQYLIFLILMPFALIAGLFQGSAQPVPRNQFQPLPQIKPTPIAPLPNIPWWNIIQSVLFWGALVGVVAFALIQYLRLNKNLWNQIKSIPLIVWFNHTFHFLWTWIKGVNQNVSTYINLRLKQLAPTPAPSSKREWFSKKGPLSPRDRVIDLYLTLIQIGKENGIQRKAGQTPYQYSQELVRKLPDVTPEVTDLTEAFVEARYSQHPVEEEKISPLHREWERIKNAFRKRPE